MSAQRHPVADLLTEEMRERVRAARFYAKDGAIRAYGPCQHPGSLSEGELCQGCLCPLAVALDLSMSPDGAALAKRLGTHRVAAVSDFVYLADSGQIDPDDIKAVLGCES